MATLAGLDPDRLPLPRRRARTVVALAQALASGALTLDIGADAEASRTSLRAIAGHRPLDGGLHRGAGSRPPRRHVVG